MWGRADFPADALKAQGILFVLPSIFRVYDGKYAAIREARDLLFAYY
jgi:hypothetical protein